MTSYLCASGIISYQLIFQSELDISNRMVPRAFGAWSLKCGITDQKRVTKTHKWFAWIDFRGWGMHGRGAGKKQEYLRQARLAGSWWPRMNLCVWLVLQRLVLIDIDPWSTKFGRTSPCHTSVVVSTAVDLTRLLDLDLNQIQRSFFSQTDSNKNLKNYTKNIIVKVIYISFIHLRRILNKGLQHGSEL